MWWRSAVNLSFFRCLAACRTRSSACATRSRPCVRCVLCWRAFPLAPTLGSTGSAAVGTRLCSSASQLSGRRRRPLKGSPPSATQTERAVFPHSAFMNGFAKSGEKGSVRQGLPCPPESGPSASDLRTSNDRIVSSKRDVRVFHKGNFPSSRSFLIYLDRSKLDPFTNVLPRTTLDPPSPVTRVIRLALQVLLRSPTPACASLPTSLPLIGLLTRLEAGTQTGLLGSRMNFPYRAVSKHLGTMGE